MVKCFGLGCLVGLVGYCCSIVLADGFGCLDCVYCSWLISGGFAVVSVLAVGWWFWVGGVVCIWWFVGLFAGVWTTGLLLLAWAESSLGVMWYGG